MSFGRDLQDFVQSFTAGYNMIGQSQKDKAAMEESKGRTELMKAQAAAIPTHQKFEEGQIEQMQKRGDFYESHAGLYDAQAAAAGRKNPDVTESTIGAIDGSAPLDGSGSAVNPNVTDPSMQPGAVSAPADDSNISGFDDTSSLDGATAADTPASDQSNYAPSSGAIPDYRTAAPTNDGAQAQAPAPHPHIAPLFSAIDQRYNLPPGYALAVSGIETGHTYDPSIVNPKSKAAGLFQFMPATARAMGVDPTNPASAAHGFGQLTLANQQILTRALGRAPTPAELYLAHQQGPAAAEMMIRNPGVPAVAVLTRAYQQAGAKNPQALAQQALVGNGGSMDMTAGQFAGKWMGQFNRELARSGGQSGAPVQVASANPAPNPGAGVSDAAPDALAMNAAPAAKPFDVNTDTPVGRAFAQRPVRSATESDAAYQARLAQYKAYNPSSEADYEKAHPDQAPGGGDALSAVNAVGSNPQGNPAPATSVQGATKAGLTAISDALMPQGNGAIPTSNVNPAAAVQQLSSGAGAASHTVVQALDKILTKQDPTYKGINPVDNPSEFYAHAASFVMSNPNLRPQERANAMGELIQYYQNGFNQYSAIAKAAVQAGNMDDAVKASIKAYMHIPNGMSVSAVKQGSQNDDGTFKYQVTFKDDKTGEVVSKQLMSPQEMGAQIMRTSPLTFQQQMLQIASVGKPAPKANEVTPEDQAAVGSMANPDTDTATAMSGANTQTGIVAVRDAAAARLADKKQSDAERDKVSTDSGQFVTDLSGQFDDPVRKKNLTPAFTAQYQSVITNNATNIQAGVAKALQDTKLTQSQILNAANNILQVSKDNPDADPAFTVKPVNDDFVQVKWKGGSVKLPTETYEAFLQTRDDMVSQLKAAQVQARNTSGAPDDRGSTGAEKPAIPAPANNPWTPSPGNVPPPAQAPGPWDQPLGAIPTPQSTF